MASLHESAAGLLASIDPERPIVDRARVAAALRRYFADLGLAAPRMRWVARPDVAGQQRRRYESATHWNIRHRYDASHRERILAAAEGRVAAREIDARTQSLARADGHAYWMDLRGRYDWRTCIVVVPTLARSLELLPDEGHPYHSRHRWGRKSPEEVELATLPEAAAAGLFAFWVRCGVALLVPRPRMCFEDGLLHRWDGGPAVVWPDGTSYYVWRGIRVPPGPGANPDLLTASRIRARRNLAVRSVLLERFGPERFLRAIGGEPAATDAFGRLWRIPGRKSDDPVLALVEVLNSTPEPDGSRRTYVLETWPGATSPREALARSFGFARAGDYAPLVET